MEKLTELNKKALGLPMLPGVYIMRDKKGEIIYIGKAKRLKNRVTSYFREGAHHEEKTARMVSNVEDFDFIVTDSEFEALVLECSLIKQNLPKYNILMKDDKGFSYIRISNERYPRITAVYKMEEDGAKYIGPYLGAFGARKMVETAVQAFGIPTCNKHFPRDIGKERPCLNYHIGRCMGVCSGNISHEEYMEAVESAITLLTKGTGEILKTLRTEMNEASERLEFEKAARLRDSINAIERIDAKQKVIKSNSHADIDVFAFAADERSTAAVVLKFRDGVLTDKDEEMLFGTTDLDEAREEFITHYYILGNEIPKIVFTDEKLESEEDFARMLSEQRGNNVTVAQPQRGDNRALVNMAYSNAIENLKLKAGRRSREEAALGELANLLGLEAVPDRIEAYDISNYGEDAVAGMSVFVKGQPRRYDYRRFIVKTVDGVDDYASMTEVLLRRVGRYDDQSKTYAVKPDLILLDGGKGHLSTISNALKGTSFEDVPLFGMVKDDRHHTRDIVGPDGELSLSSRKNAFSLVTKIQDETHRYTVGYQRDRHSKKALRSSLLDIDGIGEVRAKSLLKHFKTMDAVKAASIDQLAEVERMDRKSAERVFRYFNP